MWHKSITAELISTVDCYSHITAHVEEQFKTIHMYLAPVPPQRHLAPVWLGHAYTVTLSNSQPYEDLYASYKEEASSCLSNKAQVVSCYI